MRVSNHPHNFFYVKEKMQIKIKVSNSAHLGIKKGDIVYVSKSKYLGDTLRYGVKTPRGVVWFKLSEIEEVSVGKN